MRLSVTNRDPEEVKPVQMKELLERARVANRLPAPWRRRQIRENAGVAQRELAAALDVSVMALNRWERGLVKPRGAHAAAYAAALERLEQATVAADAPH
jgi:DNA-binding transcriptional regulator YiaG